jgi:hypothetical protein
VPAAPAGTLQRSAWEQGSLLPLPLCLPITAWAHPATQALPAVGKQIANIAKRREVSAPTHIDARAEKPGNRLLVLSQTCDVIKPAEQMPTVEVGLVFATENSATIAEASNYGSARYYRLPAPAGEPTPILDYGWREHLDKGFLLELAPDNSLLDAWDRGQRETFARWLGRRYSRPVLEDHDVASILDPIREAWGTLIRDDPEMARRCAEHYCEFRFRREQGTLWLFAISAHPTPDEALGLELTAFLSEALQPHHADVRTDLLTYATITMAQYMASEQIDIEWASHTEGIAVGALADL